MTTPLVRRAGGMMAVVSLLSHAALAQSVDVAGVRARGMGGAFTAVADDSSATWWNPAGLAAGPYADGIVEWDETDVLPGTSGHGEASVKAFSAAFPALGLSYYRFRISQMRPSAPTAATTPSRQDQGPAGLGVSTLSASQLGATVGQSIGQHLVIGTTLKWIRGGEDGAGSTNAATVDAGAMASIGVLRLGVAVRNVTSPSLGANDLFRLDRQARAGVAVMLGRGTSVATLTFAADADLTTTRLGTGDERRLAGGAEAWLFGRRLGLRGGGSTNTVGTRRTAGSAGASAALRSGFYLDGSVIRGSDDSRRGWSAGLRVTF